MSVIANTPAPPYFAVIFTSTRTPGDNGYSEMAENMGHQSWYDAFKVRIAKVERDYGI